MDEIMTPEEIAAFLRVTRRAVYQWLETDQLPGLRAGNRWRVYRSDLDKFLKRPRVSRGEKPAAEQVAVAPKPQPAPVVKPAAVAPVAASRPSAGPVAAPPTVSRQNVRTDADILGPDILAPRPNANPLAGMRRNKTKRR